MSVPHYTTGVRPTILIVDDYADALDAWEIFPTALIAEIHRLIAVGACDSGCFT
jgi:hypothetical protein